jgi:uncharacterized membrane protein (DUF485 family)
MTTVPADSPKIQPEWDRIAASAEFRSLIRAKVRYIVPATFFFLTYYFLLPVLVGYAPKLMSAPILGPLNGAYLFALSQFLMSWLVLFSYVRAAALFDREAASIVEKSVAKSEAGTAPVNTGLN